MTAILYVKNRGLYADTRHVCDTTDKEELFEINHYPKIVRAANNQFAYAITGEIVNLEPRLHEFEDLLFNIIKDITIKGSVMSYYRKDIEEMCKKYKIGITGTIIILARHICITIDYDSGYTLNITGKEYKGFGFDTPKLEATMRIFKNPEFTMQIINQCSSVSSYIDKPDCCLMADLEPISLEE